MTPAAPHRSAASLWLVVLLALGGSVLPLVHRVQHAVYAHTMPSDDAASCDLLAATLTAPLPAPLVLLAPTGSVQVETAAVLACGAAVRVGRTSRGPPTA